MSIIINDKSLFYRASTYDNSFVTKNEDIMYKGQD